MNLHYLTPHQFTKFKEFVDTLLVTTYTPLALDIATPYAASTLIAERISADVISHFNGRMEHISGGIAFMHVGSIPEWLSSLESVRDYDLRFGVVITDRALLDDFWRISTDSGVQWLVFDWWQWLKQRVPDSRLADAWMYLSLACPTYWVSQEREQLGLDESVAVSMAQEGNKLFATLSAELISRIREEWASHASKWSGQIETE
jgi:hypothetical protein